MLAPYGDSFEPSHMPVHGVLPATLSRCVETCSAAY
jgi:hypothetical protein